MNLFQRDRLLTVLAGTVIVVVLLHADVWFGDPTKQTRLLIETQRGGMGFGGVWSAYRVTVRDTTNNLPINTEIACTAWELNHGVMTNVRPESVIWRLVYLDAPGAIVTSHSIGATVTLMSDEVEADGDDVRRCHITAIGNSLTAEVYLAIITPGTDSDADWIPDAWENMYLRPPDAGSYQPAFDSGNARLEPLADGTNNLMRFILGLGAELASDAPRALRIQPDYYPVLLSGNNNNLSFTASTLHRGVWRSDDAHWQVVMPGYTSTPIYTARYAPAWDANIQLGSFGNRQWIVNGTSYSLSSARGSVRAWTAGITNAITMYAAEWKRAGQLRADDTDTDGMPDTWEELFGMPPFDLGRNDAAMDFDGDGLVNVEEFLRGLSPVAIDTDGDGLADARELELGLNPLLADTDGDGIVDGWDIYPRGANPAPLIVVESPVPGTTI